jgi:hypothetical protein
MAIAELALEGGPAGALGTGREFGEQDRLPAAAQDAMARSRRADG